MDISIDSAVVGSMYINIKFDADKVENQPRLADDIKNQKVKIDVGGKKFTIVGFRRIYRNEGNIYVEGAEIKA